MQKLQGKVLNERFIYINELALSCIKTKNRDKIIWLILSVCMIGFLKNLTLTSIDLEGYRNV